LPAADLSHLPATYPSGPSRQELPGFKTHGHPDHSPFCRPFYEQSSPESARVLEGLVLSNDWGVVIKLPSPTIQIQIQKISGHMTGNQEDPAAQ